MEYCANMQPKDADASAWLDCFGVKMPYPVGMALFACTFNADDEAEVIDLARQYMADNKLTADDAKIIKKEGVICVIAKKEVF